MAGGRRLTGRIPRPLLGIGVAVVLAHLLALHWLGRWLPGSALRPMAPPLYTRMLRPAEPPAPPPAPVVAAAPAAPPGRLQAVAPRRTPTAAATPRAAASAPAAAEAPGPVVAEAPAAPVPEAAASAPVEPTPAAAAEAPVAAASSPAGQPTAAATALDTWPADTRLRYQLGGSFRGGPLLGNARVLWQREGPRYQVRVEVNVQPFTSVAMTSQGEVRGNALHPQAYEELRRRNPRGLQLGDTEIRLADGRVVGRPGGVQDTASQFVELAHRFATGRATLEVGRAVSFWMARPGQVDLWTYDVVARETLGTRLGEVEAFHLKPRPIANPRGNITAEMWFAPSLQYLPVRIRVSMGDEAQIDLLVEAIEQR